MSWRLASNSRSRHGATTTATSFRGRHFWLRRRSAGRCSERSIPIFRARAQSGTPESMVGFAMSLPGVKTGANSTNGNPQPYLHSHMLAVRDRYRDRGLGAQLKLEQRREATFPGNRTHRVDLRSARNQERASEYSQAGRDRSLLFCEFLWCILISTARWTSDGSSGGRVVSRFGTSECRPWRAV